MLLILFHALSFWNLHKQNCFIFETAVYKLWLNFSICIDVVCSDKRQVKSPHRRQKIEQLVGRSKSLFDWLLSGLETQ